MDFNLCSNVDQHEPEQPQWLTTWEQDSAVAHYTFNTAHLSSEGCECSAVESELVGEMTSCDSNVWNILKTLNYKGSVTFCLLMKCAVMQTGNYLAGSSSGLVLLVRMLMDSGLWLQLLVSNFLFFHYRLQTVSWFGFIVVGCCLN